MSALEDIAAGADGRLPIVVAHAGVLRAVRRHAGAPTSTSPNLAGLWFAVGGRRRSRFGGLFQTGHGPDQPTPSRL